MKLTGEMRAAIKAEVDRAFTDIGIEANQQRRALLTTSQVASRY